jgi:hypothetical protein
MSLGWSSRQLAPDSPVTTSGVQTPLTLQGEHVRPQAPQLVGVLSAVSQPAALLQSP